MEQQSEQNNQPDPVSVGSALRAGREAAGLSLNEVAERLKLSLRQLDAIERDDFGALPGATFVRGFVRNYARFLEIDPTELMAALDAHFPSAATEVANLVREEQADAPSAPRGGISSGTWLVVGLVGVVLGASALWIFGHHGENTPDLAPVVSPQTASELAAAASVPAVSTASAALVAKPASASAVASAPLPAVVKATSSAAAEASAAAAKAKARAAAVAAKLNASRAAARAASGASAKSLASGSGRVAVSVSEPSWVSVMDATGNKLVFSLVAPGAPREVSGVPPFTVRVGNADKVTLTFNGQTVDLAPHTHGTTANVVLK